PPPARPRRVGRPAGAAARVAGRGAGGAAGRGPVLRLRRLLLGAPARGVDRDPRQEAGQRGGDRRPLPGGVRRGLPHADGRRIVPSWLVGEGGASGPGPGPRGAAVSEGPLRTPLPDRASAALRDTFLQQALTIATTKFIDLRKESFAGFPQGEALRDRARAIKEATLQHLDVHLERLADNVERLGGTVHWATTAE